MAVSQSKNVSGKAASTLISVCCRLNYKPREIWFILVCGTFLLGSSNILATVLITKFGQIYDEKYMYLEVGIFGLQFGTQCLFIITGILADLKFGRYKVIVLSTIFSFSLLLVSSTICLIGVLCGEGDPQVVLMWIGAAFFIGHFIAAVFFLGTVLQFGLDQLTEASSDKLSSFVHWYVWTQALSTIPLWSTPSDEQIFIFLTTSIIICIVMLILSVSVHKGVRGCDAKFICEPPNISPYRQVLEILLFAKSHRIPLHRSSLTYWDDSPPSRLDLGKNKHGGPFTNEQVEDVKTLFRLLFVLTCITIMRIVTTISLNPAFEHHLGSAQQTSYSNNPTGTSYMIIHLLYRAGFVIIFLIPLHELVIRHIFGPHYLPGMMSKINMAGFLLSANMVTNLLIDGVGHYVTTQDVQCMFLAFYGDKPLSDQVQAINITPLFLIPSALMVGIAILLLNTSILEFIVSQAPYPMRGMIIGFYYFISGAFSLLGIGYNKIFQLSRAPFSSLPWFSCCSWFYIVSITLWLIAYACILVVTRRYKYRERSEVINEYQFVENYYSSAHPRV